MQESEIISKIIIEDNFISGAKCEALISLCDNTDTGKTSYTVANNKGPVSEIVERVISLIREKFSVKAYLYVAVLTARTVGSDLGLHCDNLILDCPTHGIDQPKLREIGCNCASAVYKSNDLGCREYTALLYLDSEHKGGDIIYQDGPVSKIYTKKIETIAGRLIVTPNNQYFYHEVTPIEQDVRYSLAMWFTTNQTLISNTNDML
jgi:hypothetical protein